MSCAPPSAWDETRRGPCHNDGPLRVGAGHGRSGLGAGDRRAAPALAARGFASIHQRIDANPGDDQFDPVLERAGLSEETGVPFVELVVR